MLSAELMTEAFDRGWSDGYYDRMSDNPYSYENIELYNSYEEGYREGSMENDE